MSLASGGGKRRARSTYFGRWLDLGQAPYFTVVEHAFRTGATPPSVHAAPLRTIHLIRDVSPILALPPLSGG
jgi:hypothetical protein